MRRWIAPTLALIVAFAGVGILATTGGGPNWGMIGNDSTNSRNQPRGSALIIGSLVRVQPGPWAKPSISRGAPSVGSLAAP